VGQYRHKRSITDIGLAMLTPLVGQEFLDRYHLRDPLNRASSTASSRCSRPPAPRPGSSRRFRASARRRPGWPSGADYFDLTPDDDQKMIVETVRVRRGDPASGRHDADDAAAYPADLIAKAAELGITAINVPENFDGIAEHRSTVTNALVAEALAYGDMGLALPILAPAASRRRSPTGAAPTSRPPTSEFAGENVPQACVAIAEPHALFDPTALKTTAVRTPSGYRLDGVKSLVPPPRMPNCSSSQHNSTASRRCSSSRRPPGHRQGRPEHGDPRCGARPVELDKVSVPLSARLGEDDAIRSRTIPRPSRCPGSAGPRWRSAPHAVLDYVIPYVKEREAFGEPIARRQAVRSCAPTSPSNSTACG
jgi:alkylation response protein AidB-like acyl-CoA dehydrogenase